MRYLGASVLSLIVTVALHTPAGADIVRSAAGTTDGDITSARDAFRADLGGGIVPGANGSFGGVRREINWDAVPDGFAAPNNLPANFFNVNSPRGTVFTTPGTGFQVSANAGVAPIEFGNIDPSYITTFATFSPQRLFTALDSNVVDVLFFVAGTNTPATVSGFGAVFTDVDLSDTTSIEFFSATDVSLGSFFVPAIAGSESFSFLGVSFDTERVGRVRITSGNSALGPGVIDQNGNPSDHVVMDDFLYSEPKAVPEPAVTVLVATAIAALGIAAWRRRCPTSSLPAR